jgi:hypothetical protein
MAIRDRMQRGESAKEAESAARREFGNVGLIKEATVADNGRDFRLLDSGETRDKGRSDDCAAP